MSHLIPTPRTDKNGVMSIRHMKPQITSTTRDLPPPTASNKSGVQASLPSLAEQEETPAKKTGFIGRWLERRRQSKAEDVQHLRRNKATSTLIDILSAHDVREASRRVLNASETNLSTDNIERAIFVAQTMTRSGLPAEAVKKDCNSLLNAMTQIQLVTVKPTQTMMDTDTKVRALYDNSDWIEDNPGRAGELYETITALMETGWLTALDTERIPDMETYIEAVNHPLYQDFGIIAMWRKDYLRAAIQYPEQVDKVARFVAERRGFDQESFDAYMSINSPLAEGSL